MTDASPALRHEKLRLWLVLVAAGVLAFALAVPYFAPLIEGLLARSSKHISLPVALLAQGAQTTLLVAVFAFVGVQLAPRTGLDAPVFRALSLRTPAWPTLRRQLLPGLAAGVLATAAVALVIVAFKGSLPAVMRPQSGGVEWRGFFSAFYGGVIEELPAVYALVGVPVGLTVVAYVVLANGFGGIIFGAAFRARGLECAMIAHAVTDIFLHMLSPLVAR